MSPKAQLWCAWSIIPFVVFYLIGFAGIAGFVPPPSPMMPAAGMAAFYAQHLIGIRAGMLLGLFASGLMFVWPAAVSVQMARIEKGPLFILSIMQYVSASVLCTFFILCSVIWSLAAFRTDVDPAMTRMLNDAGWLLFVLGIPEYLAQLISIAVVGLMDKRPNPFLPRWACFATLWVAFIGDGGGLACFFKSGPFAWTGIIGFYIPITLFVLWLVFLLLPFLVTAIKRQAAEEAAFDTGPIRTRQPYSRVPS
jgi:hypothetical protein